MVFLVCNGTTVIKVEAPTLDSAYQQAVPTLLVTEYAKQHGNMIGVLEPESQEDWKELVRRMTVSTGEFYEHFGYPNSLSACLLEYLKKAMPV